MDRTKALHGPRTQAYGETNYLDEKTRFWTEPRYCMVLGLKPMGKPITWMRKSSFGPNQGIAWSSDSSLRGTNYFDEKIEFWTEPRHCMVLGLKPLGNQLLINIKIEFWTEPRYCMVLGLKPMGKPTTWMRKLAFGRNQGIAWSSDSSLWGNQLLR